MRIQKHPDSIGKSFRKISWTDCSFIVEDIGYHSVWGIILDEKENTVRMRDSFSILDDWELSETQENQSG